MHAFESTEKNGLEREAKSFRKDSEESQGGLLTMPLVSYHQFPTLLKQPFLVRTTLNSQEPNSFSL